MEPLQTLAASLAAKAIEKDSAAREQARGFLNKVVGPAAEAIGECWAIRHRERMFNNLVDIAIRAKEKLQEAGLDPREVPLKVIHPLLEPAGLQEDPTLQDLWANLLANSSDPRNLVPITTSFPNILNELGSPEVRFLDHLYSIATSRTSTETDVWFQGQSARHVTRVEFLAVELIEHYTNQPFRTADRITDRERFEYENESFAFSLDLVLRNRLLSLQEVYNTAADNFAGRDTNAPDLQSKKLEVYGLTQLGV